MREARDLRPETRTLGRYPPRKCRFFAECAESPARDRCGWMGRQDSNFRNGGIKIQQILFCGMSQARPQKYPAVDGLLPFVDRSIEFELARGACRRFEASKVLQAGLSLAHCNDVPHGYIARGHRP